MAILGRRGFVLLFPILLCIGYITYSVYFAGDSGFRITLQETKGTAVNKVNALMHTTAPRAVDARSNSQSDRQSVLKQAFESASQKHTSEEEDLKRIRKYTNTLASSTEVTLVTAYFNLGTLNKRGSEGQYTPDLYKRWMSVFGILDNPLFVFTDSNDTASYIRQLRAGYPADRTVIVILDRDNLWAFQMADEIRKIYAQPNYPKHPPNTINALYSCAMHAKFELVQTVVQHVLFKTPYVAWLDIGLFRAEAKRKSKMHLTAPTDFNRSKVAYSCVSGWKDRKPMEIVSANMVWVGGASFLATPDVAYIYCSDYRKAVRKLLDMKVMSTDQQVIYSMYQPSFDFHPRVEIQAYTNHKGYNSWFYVGYAMRDAP